MKAPLIIIGMHRSGTSLVAKVLEKAGIFMGVIKDHNYEAMHFLSLNQQAMWSAGNDWHNPAVPDKIHWKTLPAKVLYHEHFRIKGRIQKLSLKLKNPRWGWKDPRNTFTLPMWLSIFPNAKVLHVIRETEDVAQSLKNRNNVAGEVHDEKLNNLDFNRELARKYVEQGRSYKSKSANRYFEIHYEDLVKLDKSKIAELEKFTGVQLFKFFREYVKN